MSFRLPTLRRTEGRGGLTRIEARALERSRRARGHLARVRRQTPVRTRSPRRTGAIFAVLSFAAGAFGGAPLLAYFGERAARDHDRPRIHVGGAARVALPDVAAAIGADDTAALAALSPAEIAGRIARNPWVAEARAVRLPTGSLVARVVERVPAAIVAVGDPAVFFAVDAGGTPFAPAGEAGIEGLPTLTAPTPVVSGERNADLALAIALVETAAAAGFAAREVEIAPEADAAFAVRFDGLAPRVIFSAGDPGAAVEKLVRLMDADVPEVRSAGTIDLRFADQAVLRDAPSPQEAATAAATRGYVQPSNSGQPGDPVGPSRG